MNVCMSSSPANRCRSAYLCSALLCLTGMIGSFGSSFVFAIASASGSAAPPFFGQVVSVTESNSLVISRDSGDRVQVVLAFLSIPLGDQPYADRAHRILRAQLLGRRVSVRPLGSGDPRYILGLVYVGDQSFNLDFLSRGHAWVDYHQVSHPAWLGAQNRAKTLGLGLYADPAAKHPREWATDMTEVSRLLSATDSMSSDADFAAALLSIFVGNRTTREFVSMHCFALWSTWPTSDLVPHLTFAGAEDSGYSQIPCEPPDRLSPSQ